jgi:hypothetical protein
MTGSYATARKNSIAGILLQPLPAEIVAELEADHRREMRKLSDLAFVFLNAADGDRCEAEKLLDDAIELLFEGGAFSMWRYRVLLGQIREGL